MSKKIFIIITIALALAGFIFILSKPKHSNEITAPILFYSNSCPHCQNVENFIHANDVLNKTQLLQKNVDNDPGATRELVNYAAKCNLLAKTVSIPFLWDGSTCLTGDQTIIDYLNNRIK